MNLNKDKLCVSEDVSEVRFQSQQLVAEVTNSNTSVLCWCSWKQMMNTHRPDADTMNSCRVLKLEHRVDCRELSPPGKLDSLFSDSIVMLAGQQNGERRKALWGPEVGRSPQFNYVLRSGKACSREARKNQISRSLDVPGGQYIDHEQPIVNAGRS